ncbi:MAG: U32 family peptidase C-terminal domain-containing protein [Clostridia bacterium]|nr:U32 family peptidase C-terminal domain-containing protein [Clostridia bacterium]
MELLAPAGNMEKLQYAVAYGADAVYAAYRSFGLRAASENFDEQELKAAIDYCHARGKKIYITANIYPTHADLLQLPAYFEMLESLKPDGLIIADLGVMAMAKRYAPSIPIHISTQANVTNYEAARTYHELGASRIVLAREMPLADIRALREKLPAEVELECFAHGAMCIAYSGRCLLSAVLTGRSGNQGACAQPCRWSYDLVERTRPDQQFPLEEDERGTYLFNSKDLCLIQYLKELEEAGIASLKIEGRMKSFYYAACVSRAYRRALDDMEAGKPFDPALLEELKGVSHRDYTTAFLFGAPGAEAQNFKDGGYIRNTDVVAVASDETGVVIQKNKFSVGETLWVLEPERDPYPVTIELMADENGEAIESAPHAEMRVRLNFELPPFAILRRERRI